MTQSQEQEFSPEVKHGKDSGAQDSSADAKQRLSSEFVSEPAPHARRSGGGGSHQPKPSGDDSTDTGSTTQSGGIPPISDGAPRITSFLEEPGNGENAVHQAILGAQKSVQMWMYHLTDPGSISALEKAHENGRDVSVILDSKSLQTPSFDVGPKALQADGVNTVPSSDAFNISHAKTFLIDGKDSYITSINLTKTANVTRDFGISTDDPMIASDLNNLFQADLKNAQTNGGDTPALVSPFLVVSPIDTAPNAQTLQTNQSQINDAVASLSPSQKAAAINDFSKATSTFTVAQNSTMELDQLAAERDLSKMPNGAQLVELFAEKMQAEQINRIQGVIDHAQTKVVGETENLGATEIQNSIIAAAKRGVEVDLIIPEADRGANFNGPAVAALLAASKPIEAQGLPGIHIKEMPGPQSVDTPYTHAKWLVADNNKEAYLGSENYTNNSLHHSREIGIIINDAPTMQKMVNDFTHDWSVADGPPFNNPTDNQNSN